MKTEKQKKIKVPKPEEDEEDDDELDEDEEDEGDESVPPKPNEFYAHVIHLPTCNLSETRDSNLWLDSDTGTLFSLELNSLGKHYLTQLNNEHLNNNGR